MRHRRLYYPLKPAGYTSRRPNVCYLSVENTITFHAAAIRDEFLFEFDQPEEIAEFISHLPPRAWVVSYNLEWAKLLANYLKYFQEVEGSPDASILYIRMGPRHVIYLMDFQSFTLETLPTYTRALNMKPIESSSEEEGRVKTIAILWNQYAEKYITYFGAYPSKTPGSTALTGFKRFMDEPIKPRGKKIRQLTTKSIRAPGLHWTPGYYPRAYMYDINGAYVFAQSITHYPGHVLSFCNEAPKFPFWIATVKASYNTARKFSPLSVKLNDETVYPREVINHRLTLTYIDAFLLSQTGDFEITEWIEGVCWPPSDHKLLFAEWASVVGGLQGTDKKLMKVTTRALHSKFCQKSQTARVKIVEIDPHKCKGLIASGRVADFIPLESGGLAIKLDFHKRDGYRNYWRPDFEALTLAMCRLILYTAADEHTVYMDTDSIISTVERNDLTIGRDLGQWKRVAQGPCFIAGPRAYAIGNHVRASGIFPLDYGQLKQAIVSAVDQGQGKTQAIERANLFSNSEGRVRPHTIRASVYPKTQVTGNIAMVSRSPAVRHDIKPVRRIYSQRREEANESKEVNGTGIDTSRDNTDRTDQGQSLV